MDRVASKPWSEGVMLGRVACWDLCGWVCVAGKAVSRHGASRVIAWCLLLRLCPRRALHWCPANTIRGGDLAAFSCSSSRISRALNSASEGVSLPLPRPTHPGGVTLSGSLADW